MRFIFIFDIAFDRLDEVLMILDDSIDPDLDLDVY